MILMALSCRGDRDFGGTRVPWATVAEIVSPANTSGSVKEATNAGRARFFVQARPNGSAGADHALQPRQAALLELSEGLAATSGGSQQDVSVCQWQDSCWRPLSPLPLRRQSRQLRLSRGIAHEGFFRVVLPSTSPAQGAGETASYAVVVRNWKKDLLLFCRQNKERAERSDDPELVRSSVVASHWEHVMDLASAGPALTDAVLQALGQAVQARKDFESGTCPPLATGLNELRLRRFPGATTEEFVVFVPEHAPDANALPLVVHCDSGRFAARDRYQVRTGYIDLWWHTVTDKDVDWKSYQMLRAVMSRSVPADPDRVYVAGECLNGLAAMSLALNHPDHWAECCVSLGNTYRYLAGNALNLPLILFKGGHTDTGYDAYFDFAVKCFRYHQLPCFRSDSKQDATQLRGTPLPRAVRERRPARVSYTIESLHNATAYWVTIAGRDDENQLGKVEARVEGQTIQVTTDNVDAYVLNLAGAPVDANRPVQIVENGRALQTVTGPVFVRPSPRHQGAPHVKTSRLSGPLWDAFTDAYVVVWGNSGTDAALTAANRETARALAGEGPCLADTDLSEKVACSCNLVLVGTPASNRWLARVDAALPVRVVQGRIEAGVTRCAGPDAAYMLIYPNPLATEHYVAVYGATSAQAMSALPQAYAQMRMIRPADVGVFELTGAGTLRWRILERLDTTWSWHQKYARGLMTLRRRHPAWQWQQWLASVLRRQLGQDVVLYGEPFLFEDALPLGRVTYRDLFNSFRNYWIQQVRINGADLRQMVTAPFTHPAPAGKIAPAVAGVALTALTNPAGEKTLGIAELANDRTYRAALSEQCLKGGPLGVVPQDYEIVGQVYLVPTLASFLEAHPDLDMDAELERAPFPVL
jgi:hypothetical protein